MSRLSKMNTLINSLADVSFKYGKNDCYTFTEALVQAWHGKDFKMHRVYKNEKQARKYIHMHGGLIALVDGTLGYSLKSPELAVDGDVVITNNVGPDDALGFVFDGCGLFRMKKSVVKIPLNKCLIAWHIK